MTLLVVVGTQQVTGDVLHLFRQQRRAVNLDQTQHAMGGMQLVGALFEKHTLVGALGVGLERGARIVQSRREFFGDDVQGLGTDVGHAGIAWSIKRRSRLPCVFFRYCRSCRCCCP